MGKNKQGLPAGRLQRGCCVLTRFSTVAASITCWIKQSETLNPAADPQLSFGPFWSTPCFIKAFQTDASLQENCRFTKNNVDERNLFSGPGMQPYCRCLFSFFLLKESLWIPAGLRCLFHPWYWCSLMFTSVYLWGIFFSGWFLQV